MRISGNIIDFKIWIALSQKNLKYKYIYELKRRVTYLFRLPLLRKIKKLKRFIVRFIFRLILFVMYKIHDQQR